MGGGPRVLMVAEKPSIAATVSSILARGGTTQRTMGPFRVFDFECSFLHHSSASISMLGLFGHILSTDFPAEMNNWRSVTEVELYNATCRKIETKGGTCHWLREAAAGCAYLCLWLDCDREGENICFEVINTIGRQFSSLEHVYRAHFYALTPGEINGALARLGRPDKNQSNAVEARQELDLKVGVSFTRLLTKYFQRHYSDRMDTKLLSYGPCQTPTLHFCVQRADEIAAFESEPFWYLAARGVMGGVGFSATWSRDRVFDRPVANLLHQQSSRQPLTVESLTVEPFDMLRPTGLNTVGLLRACASQLGLGAFEAMKIAEDLYLGGILSYPRTESTAYPADFNFEEIVLPHVSSPMWGESAGRLLAQGEWNPRPGQSMGDHPPITPMKYMTPGDRGVDGNRWAVYQLVVQHFLASLLPNCALTQTTVRLRQGEERYTYVGRTVEDPGYTSVMRWRALTSDNIPPFVEGAKCSGVQCFLREGQTEPPDYLTESELITLMDENGIGTDASIPTHIKNVCDRKYVHVRVKEGTRYMVPSGLGIGLIRGFGAIDGELVRPQVRSMMEAEVTRVAEGRADVHELVAHMLDQFLHKFIFFVEKLDVMAAYVLRTAEGPSEGGSWTAAPRRGGRGRGFRGGGRRGHR